MADETRKSELIAELARARGEMTAQGEVVRRKTDIAAHFKSSFRRHALPWLGGAALFSILLTALPRRRKVVPKYVIGKKEQPAEKAVKAGVVLTAAKLVFDLARPILLRWVTQRIAQYAERRAAPPR